MIQRSRSPRDVGDQSWRPRLLVPAGKLAGGVFPAGLPTRPARASFVAPPFGWTRLTDDDRPRKPFPSQHALGASCGNAYNAMYRWAAGTLSLVPTLGLGYVSWFVLLAGFIAVLRASGRGRSGFEAAGVILLAVVPVVWGALIQYYHPEDLLAMGLALGGVACSLRRKWVWAGLLLGLAVTSQQFSLLILAPLVVVVPGSQRLRLIASSAAAVDGCFSSGPRRHVGPSVEWCGSRNG